LAAVTARDKVVRKALSRIRRAGIAVVASALGVLPAAAAAGVKSRLKPVGKLDYSPTSIRMYVNGPWQVYRLRSCAKEPETVRWLEEEIKRGDCLYDIGANVGAYSLVANAVAQGMARIFAFEPGFATFKELCLNIQLNRAERAIVPLPFALADRAALRTLRYSDPSPGAAQHTWEGEQGVGALGILTPVFNLDSIVEFLGIPPPNLMKLDVDGPELKVLNGAKVTLAHPGLRSVLVELDESSETMDGVVAILAKNGLRARSRHPRGRPGLYNVIFGR
jgi:FkbM family methyltransferase